MKKISVPFIIILLTSYSLLFGQSDSTNQITERWLLDFPFFDYPFIKYSGIAAGHKRADQTSDLAVNPKAADYLRSYENLSMYQAMALSRDLHYTNYYFQNIIWNQLIPPATRGKRLLNRVVANVSAGVIDYALAYQIMILSPVWLHEEFHRTGLSLHGIASHNDTYYRFTKNNEDAGGSVSEVFDADLIRFKQIDPVGLVRSFESGIESQYLLLRNMQKDNFFRKTQYPNVAMNILLSNAAINYVNQFKRDDYDQTIDSMNANGSTIAGRDFVGWDFTAWVYDMFRPDEPYQDRGVHPLGNGIDRIIKRSDLTEEEDDYLIKMGKMQYLNYISPALIGINRIRINEHTWFNFAVRHMLTSFGYDLSLDIYLDSRGKQWLVGLHNYQNQNHRYVAIELERMNIPIRLINKKLEITTRAMAWVQPEKESFYATRGVAGGLLGIRADGKITPNFNFYIDLEGKTRGWVAGNPFLESNLSFRTGLQLDIRSR